MKHLRTRWRFHGLVFCGLILLAGSCCVAAATSTDTIWAAQAFQRLAALDLSAAQEVWMPTSIGQQWQEVSEAALADPLDAAAFFGHMLWFPMEGPRGTWLVGLFNPWVGGLLVVQFDEAASQVESYALATIDIDSIANESSLEFEESIRGRLVDGADAFESIATAWPRRGGPEPNPVGWDILSGRLEAYREEMRRLLSPEGFSVWEGARANYAAARETLAGEELPDTFLEADRLALVWRQTIIPVWASEHADSLNVVVSADSDPYSLLWLSLKTTSSDEPIHDLAVIDLLDLLVGTGGGQ